MRIADILSKKRTVSFEVFPPKPDQDLEGISWTLSDLASCPNDWVSVTYGAGGSNRDRVFDVLDIANERKLLLLSHLTAVEATREQIRAILDALAARGVENILALRGDVPPHPEGRSPWKDFSHATDLIELIAEDGRFCIGAAAYPERHPESETSESDLKWLKTKADLGASFFVTQLFFDNELFYRFRDRLSALGVEIPVIAGIMPVFRASQIDRIIELSGCSVPGALTHLIAANRDDARGMLEAGTEFAASQIRDLWKNGVAGIHLYTMNKSAQSLEILARCPELAIR